MTNQKTIRVTFTHFSKELNKRFENVEEHRNEADARLRAMALNWQIKSIVPLTQGRN